MIQSLPYLAVDAVTGNVERAEAGERPAAERERQVQGAGHAQVVARHPQRRHLAAKRALFDEDGGEEEETNVCEPERCKA